MSGQHIESSLGDDSILNGAYDPLPVALTDTVWRLVVNSGNGDLLPMIFGGAV